MKFKVRFATDNTLGMSELKQQTTIDHLYPDDPINPYQIKDKFQKPEGENQFSAASSFTHLALSRNLAEEHFQQGCLIDQEDDSPIFPGAIRTNVGFSYTQADRWVEVICDLSDIQLHFIYHIQVSPMEGVFAELKSKVILPQDVSSPECEHDYTQAGEPWPHIYVCSKCLKVLEE